jgi:SAM-dependent methyltransferase
MTTARYDGLADWYQEFRPRLSDAETEALRRLAGSGPGRCIELGCGTGLVAAFLEALGWSTVGVDVSADLLDVARKRGVEVRHVNGETLPFEENSFDLAVSVWSHTDVEDFPAVLREIARVLRAGAPFVYIGGHPCFVGPHSYFLGAEGTPVLHPGYLVSGRYHAAPGVANPDGLRARVGAVHLPLGAFIDAFPSAGLGIEHFEEINTGEYPHMVALRCSA